MITVPARRVKQFSVEFYQAGLSAKDIDRLVKFEVLGYSGGPNGDDKAKGKKTKPSRARVNWDSLERRISESEAAYQRPVIRRKIDELVAYFLALKGLPDAAEFRRRYHSPTGARNRRYLAYRAKVCGVRRPLHAQAPL